MLSPRPIVRNGRASTSVLFDTSARAQREACARPRALLSDRDDVEAMEQDLFVLHIFSDLQGILTSSALLLEAVHRDVRTGHVRHRRLGRTCDACKGWRSPR